MWHHAQINVPCCFETVSSTQKTAHRGVRKSPHIAFLHLFSPLLSPPSPLHWVFGKNRRSGKCRFVNSLPPSLMIVLRNLVVAKTTSAIDGGKGGGVVRGYHEIVDDEAVEEDEVGWLTPTTNATRIRTTKKMKKKRVRFQKKERFLPVGIMEEEWPDHDDEDEENHPDDPQPGRQKKMIIHPTTVAKINCCEDDFATSVWELDVHNDGNDDENDENEEDSEVTAIIVNGSKRKTSYVSTAFPSSSSSHRGEDGSKDVDDSTPKRKKKPSRRGRSRRSRSSDRGHPRRQQRHSSSPSVGSSSNTTTSSSSGSSRGSSKKRLRRCSPSPSLTPSNSMKKGRGRVASTTKAKDMDFNDEYTRQQVLLQSPYRLSNLSYSDRVVLASARPFSPTSSSITSSHHSRRQRRSPSPSISSSQRTCRSLPSLQQLRRRQPSRSPSAASSSSQRTSRSLPTLQHVRPRSRSPSLSSSSQRTSRSLLPTLATLLQASSSTLQVPSALSSSSSSQSYSRMSSSFSSLQSSKSSLSSSSISSSATSSTLISTCSSSSFHRRQSSVNTNTNTNTVTKVGDESFQSKCRKLNLVF